MKTKQSTTPQCAFDLFEKYFVKELKGKESIRENAYEYWLTMPLSSLNLKDKKTKKYWECLYGEQCERKMSTHKATINNNTVIVYDTPHWMKTEETKDVEHVFAERDKLDERWCKNPTSIPVDQWSCSLLKKWFSRPDRTSRLHEEPFLSHIDKHRCVHGIKHEYLCSFIVVKKGEQQCTSLWIPEVYLLLNPAYKECLESFHSNIVNHAKKLKSGFIHEVVKKKFYTSSVIDLDAAKRQLEHYCNTTIDGLSIDHGSNNNAHPSPCQALPITKECESFLDLTMLHLTVDEKHDLQKQDLQESSHEPLKKTIGTTTLKRKVDSTVVSSPLQKAWIQEEARRLKVLVKQKASTEKIDSIGIPKEPPSPMTLIKNSWNILLAKHIPCYSLVE